MSDGELRDQLVTLLLAGHETTATALAWAFDQMLRAPDALDRATMRSARRQPPSVLTSMRSSRRRFGCDRRFRSSTGESPYRSNSAAFQLPAGTIGRTLHLPPPPPDQTPTPTLTRFDPSASSTRRPDTYAWLPFGGGVRRCLGASFATLEMRLVLQTILENVELRPARARAEKIHRRAIVSRNDTAREFGLTGDAPTNDGPRQQAERIEIREDRIAVLSAYPHR